MATQVSKLQFKARALEYSRQVKANGKPVVVTDHGQPKVEIRRYRPRSHRSPLDALRGSVLHHDAPAPTEPLADGQWDALR